MPHVTFVPLTGLRVREEELLALGMSLPGLAARGQAIGQLPALGLLTLAGMLPDDWTCDYLPASRADDELIERVVAGRPTLVAISALTASIGTAYRMSDQLRLAGVRTVVGGLHVTACPDEAARHADAVVVGSGELVWRDVLADAAIGALKPSYRPARRMTRADWPQPRLDLLGESPPRFTLQTERGCPLACDFCGASRLLGPFEEKPIAAIRSELAAIRAVDSRPLIELADDNTFAGQRDPSELLATLEEAGVRYFTEADWRIGARPDVLAGLTRSGCAQVLVGIESLVFRYPGMGSKQAELARMMDAVETIQGACLSTAVSFSVRKERLASRLTGWCVSFTIARWRKCSLRCKRPFPARRSRGDWGGKGGCWLVAGGSFTRCST